MAKRSGILLLACTLLLISLGITMLVSTNYHLDAHQGGGETYRNVWNQVVWLCIGFVALGLGSTLNYQHLLRFRWLLLTLSVLGMVACLFEGTGREVNGARRWLNLPGGIGGQPSEFAKIAVLIAIAGWYARHASQTRTFLKGVIAPMGILAIILAAFWFQKDLGNAILIGIVVLGVMFVAGVRWFHIILMTIIGSLLAAAAVIAIPNRVERIQAFLNPEANSRSLQQEVSKLAFGSGGIEGRGLGEGRMKLSYLPEAHTDFIFPMIGEELGFTGSALTVLMFIILVASGMCISAYAPDRFGKLLGMGITSLIASEALLNMGVTTALLPNKGLPLPFVSYGGSSLVAACLAIGILVNIYRQGLCLSRDQLPVIRRKHRWTPQM